VRWSAGPGRAGDAAVVGPRFYRLAVDFSMIERPPLVSIAVCQPELIGSKGALNSDPALCFLLRRAARIDCPNKDRIADVRADRQADPELRAAARSCFDSRALGGVLPRAAARSAFIHR